MLAIGTKVVYGTNGVCEIADIRREEVAGEARNYYVLRAGESGADSLIFVPVDSEKLVAQMRPLLSREEVEAIILRAASLPETDWPTDNRRRSELFRKIIDSGDRTALISLIKTIYNAGKRREDIGKKNYLADEQVMKRAEKILYSEFAEVLDIAPGEVVRYIAERCNESCLSDRG